MTTLPRIFSEQEAAEYLRLPEKTLRNIRYRGKIAHLRRGFYLQKHLDDYLQSIEVLCADNQSSSNVVTLPSGSSTSRKVQDNEQAALARAKQIIAKQNASSRNGSLNAKSHNSPQQSR